MLTALFPIDLGCAVDDKYILSDWSAKIEEGIIVVERSKYRKSQFLRAAFHELRYPFIL
jgi:hypothetical protein